MRLNTYCIRCQVEKQEQKIRSFPDEQRKVEYMKQILRQIADAGETDCAPSLSTGFRKLFTAYWGVPEKDYTDIKKEYNLLMLKLEEVIYQKIQAAFDPLEMALLYAQIGNYIDYAALPDVNPEMLLSLLDSEDKGEIDPEEYFHFVSDLSAAKELLYITDNCGEIVLDKLVIRVLLERFPQLSVTVLVRGGQVVNDADFSDAAMCGLTELVPVIDNGNLVPGTHLPSCSAECREALERADVILSKGQGNFETLHDCGRNIYYLFLCKCQYFQDRFHARPLQGMFINEKRVPD